MCSYVYAHKKLSAQFNEHVCLCAQSRTEGHVEEKLRTKVSYRK